MTDAVLTVDDLSINAGALPLVEGVSFHIARGEMLGLLGESGCGKTMTALSIMRLLADPVKITGGRILFGGADLAQAAPAELRRLRGNRIAMIFQEPMTSLNPVFSIGEQIAETLQLHRKLSRAAARDRAAELLALVGIPAAREALGRFPHNLSGGQRQRVMIAMALACEPDLLIADEPTTALDVTVQAQILALIDDLRKRLGMACLLITHDLGVIAEVCDRAAVMYAGRIVEEGPVEALYARPRHRYTRALLDTRPASNVAGARLPTISGMVPPPGSRGAGCAFAPRCAAPVEPCAHARPALGGGAHSAACWNPAA